MKKIILVICSLLLLFAVVNSVMADKGTKGAFDAKVGDAIYVCGCGDGCDCGSLAKQEGKCGCGQDLVKTTVTKVEKGTLFYKLNGKELPAPTQGKYACGCGKGCGCGSISQKPGKCGCGKDMVIIKE